MNTLDSDPKGLLDSIIAAAHKAGASDIHISPFNRPYVRVNGDIMPLDNFPILNRKTINSMAIAIMSERDRAIFKSDMQADLAYSGGGMRHRVNIFSTINGVSMALRQIEENPPSFDDLGLPDVVRRMATLRNGLVLIAGPTGSGKTTTMSAMIRFINENYRRHIITIEDPIEYIHKNRMSLIEQREIGKSAKSFSGALRGALREDPDVIVVGELRDAETIGLALTAAETGHLVLGTLHTMSAAKTIDRIIDGASSEDKEMYRTMLSTSLKGVVLQSLLKRNGGGRVAAFEVLVATGAVRNLIRENKVPQIESMIQTGSQFGMISMKDYVMKLLNAGIISQAEADEKLGELGDNNRRQT